MQMIFVLLHHTKSFHNQLIYFQNNMSTRKNFGKYVGFSTSALAVSAIGIWDSITQSYFRRKSEWPDSKKLSATGGTVRTPGNGIKYHVFTSPGTLTVTGGSNNSGSLLALGGGGPGSVSPYCVTCAGGGAGGMIYVSGNYEITSSIPITIGPNGGGPYSVRNTVINDPLGTLTALGGGAGGSAGGCGGGGSGYGAGGQSALQPANNGAYPNSGFGFPGAPAAPGQQGNFANQGGSGGGCGGSGSGPGGAGGVAKAIPEFSSPVIGPALPGPVASVVGPTGRWGQGAPNPVGDAYGNGNSSFGGIVLISYPYIG